MKSRKEVAYDSKEEKGKEEKKEEKQKEKNSNKNMFEVQQTV